MWKVSAAAAAMTSAASAIAASVEDGSCPSRYGGDASCGSVAQQASLASENLLLQRSTGRVSYASTHLSSDEDTPMVIDETGFEGGEIEGIEDTGCAAADVRRRRRVDSMCSCRRRDS